MVANPFAPGRGQTPPFLADRETEQGSHHDLLAYLLAGRGPPRDAILSGPRGNGKTVLLRLAARVAVAFDGGGMLREHELDAVIAEVARDDVHVCRDALAGLGYVWKAPGDEDRWRPGIASLMAYVAGHAPGI